MNKLKKSFLRMIQTSGKLQLLTQAHKLVVVHVKFLWNYCAVFSVITLNFLQKELWIATTVAGFLHIVQMFSIPSKLLHSRILWTTATISTTICALVYSGVPFLYFLKITHLPIWLSIKDLPRSQRLVFCPS